MFPSEMAKFTLSPSNSPSSQLLKLLPPDVSSELAVDVRGNLLLILSTVEGSFEFSSSELLSE